MKYFIDTEFIEGSQKTWWGGNTKPTIDLISIGIVAEDGREYYAISKDFNLKEAWNRYDLSYGFGDERNRPPRKIYWLRENVLKPIFNDWIKMKNRANHMIGLYLMNRKFSYKNFKCFLQEYGKSNKQIVKEVKWFISSEPTVTHCSKPKNDVFKESYLNSRIEKLRPTFYGYYCDYDWVVFCWLFGKMIDLPKGFPMYCRDLKQMLDERCDQLVKREILPFAYSGSCDGESLLEWIKAKHHSYPKQTNEHSALDDARWNKKLYDFIQDI